MKFAKSILTGAGAVVLAGLILALLAPRAAHAIVATAVQVENTVASPVVSQSILPGTPFSASCQTFDSGNCDLSPTIPAGYTFHATYFSAELLYNANSKAPDQMSVTYRSNGTYLQDFEIAAPTLTFTIASHPVDWYIDPGTYLEIISFSAPVNGAPGEFMANVSGYLTH